MTVVTLNRKELEKYLGKITKDVEEKISMFGTPVESSTDTELQIDVTPNRPDLLSMQGFVRAISCFLKNDKSKSAVINKPEKNFKVSIEKPAKEWPHAVCAIIKNIKLNDVKIKEIIEIQEKLTNSIGRKRKKLGLGVYPLDKINLPIRYTAKKPSEIKFRPLEFDKEITGLQVLSQHPTGREYAHLVKGWEKFPVFIDAKDQILSMPPIVNSHDTGKVSEATKDLFLECTGNNLAFLKKAMNILVMALADMGGEVYQMKIEDKVSFVSPDLGFEKMPFQLADINKTLGLELSEKEVKACLEKMGLGYEKGAALVPAYRTDILHWIDIAEEVAIAYGYENFVPEIPRISTIAEESKIAILRRRIAEILNGLGLLECSSYHLNTKDEIKRIHFDFKDFIEVEDSKTEYNALRVDLLTNSLKILSENSDSVYPHRIFESGIVFELDKSKTSETGILEKTRLCISLAGEDENFTELKRVLDYLFKMLNLEYSLKETENNDFIPGRVGAILIKGKEIGYIGEIAPRVLKNWNINAPVVSLELNLDSLL